MSILIENVSKNFGNFEVLSHLYLEIQKGSLVALVGPSGSGKSTLLRILAGLEKLDEGRVWFAGQNFTHISVQDRKIGFVFQEYALFQNMTVYENIAYGLTIRSCSSVFIEERVQKLLELVELQKLGDRYPPQLSGGQQQRVAVARAVSTEPDFLLLDEPFGALDTKLRRHLRKWLRELHKKGTVTTVFVTHDHQEALEIANKIVILEKGQVKFIGNPEDFVLFQANAH
jgi:sulfate/thiosulfate transport system ATP-binding protein